MFEKLVFIKGEWKFVQFEEPAPVCEDPTAALRSKIYDALQNAFSLAYCEGEELKLSVDNIFPLLKSLGFNPQNESVVDLVREASIETFGDIDPKDFETVVLNLVKEKDEELWAKRLEDKEHLHRVVEAEKAKAEAERIRLEAERQKAGFEREEEDEDEWREYEKKKQELEEKRQKELKEDELYDNMKMAFRFIDADEDGVISTQDLYLLMMGLGEMMTDDELFGMLNMADVDCDGKVTFDDFRTFLLPQSGDESLILSPAAIAQQLLANKVLIPSDKTTEETESSRPEGEGEGGKSGENELSPEEEEADKENDEQKTEVKTEKPEEKEVVIEISEEEKERLKKRRQSMLWGYTTASKSSTTVRKESLPSVTSVDDEVFKDSSSPKVEIEITGDTVKSENDSTNGGSPDNQDPSSLLQLGAIKEEDEHSNYGIETHDEESADENELTQNNNKSDNRPISLVESKRKLFSRQSSSASLKTKITDSFGDSGVETMDSVNCSETREQPDVFDIDMAGDDFGGEKVTPSLHSTLRRGSSRAIYDDNEDDEDMVDAHHVHESLSRVSSSESLSKLEELESEMPTERVRNFVNEIMYVEVQGEPSEEAIQAKLETEEKLNRAETLQKAILKHSFTAPQLTVTKSKTGRPQTARPSVNGISCSHIDIDLTCEAPPKAAIKSYRQFNERVKSARTTREIYGANDSPRKMGIIDITDRMDRDETASPSSERRRWPMRPLTRPRSPVTKRRYIASEKQISLDLTCVSMEKCQQQTQSRSFHHRRSKSANPLGRSTSPGPSTSQVPLKRPQTATLPYTSSRFEDDKKRDLLVSEPFANSDELYPNKTVLTSFHHGFKSIWPIGRKINLIQNKRPFEAFEMNSYSRAVERRQFPFKGDHSIDIQSAQSRVSTNCVKPLTVNKKIISLSIDPATTHVKKPVVRKLSLYIAPNSTPRSVRSVR